MESPISKCFTDFVTGYGSAKLMMEYLLSKNLSRKGQQIIMRILLKTLDLNIGYFPFKTFDTIFHIFETDEQQIYPDKLGFFTPFESRELQKYSEY